MARWPIIRHVVLVFVVPLLLSACLRGTPAGPAPASPGEVGPLEVATWEQVQGWQQDDPALALSAFLRSCIALGKREGWQEVCVLAEGLDAEDNLAVRGFFERNFLPHRVVNADGSDSGTVTGYYVPELPGSRMPSERFAHPIYAVPGDLLVIDLGDLYPELKGKRLRGRLEGRRVVPYFDRTQIDGVERPLAGQELFWVEDAVELFFLHVQGSGRIRLEDGEVITVNYGNQNGHPYRSIGKELIARGEMTLDNMSLQAIVAWAEANPEKLEGILGHNPSYIFFRELPAGDAVPPGSLGVPLTSGRSLAVDRRFIPLGAPVFLSTTWPNSDIPLQRLMMAQDTGGAIKGPVRADFFWGLGRQAGSLAGRMKQQGQMWVLLPRGAEPPGAEVASR